jgi:hypothetical protein
VFDMNKINRITVLAALLVGGPAFAAEAVMDGKPVTAYHGTFQLEGSPMQGRAVVKHENGTGNWTFGQMTYVMIGTERVPRQALEFAERVTVWVSQDGFMHRIAIDQMKPGWPTGPDVGTVAAYDPASGAITINMAKSTGNWRCDRTTRVLFDGHDVPTADIQRSRQVRARVAQDGRVISIEIVRMK